MFNLIEKENTRRKVKYKNPSSLNPAMRIALLYYDQYNYSEYHHNKQMFKKALNEKTIGITE